MESEMPGARAMFVVQRRTAVLRLSLLGSAQPPTQNVGVETAQMTSRAGREAVAVDNDIFLILSLF